MQIKSFVYYLQRDVFPASYAHKNEIKDSQKNFNLSTLNSGNIRVPCRKNSGVSRENPGTSEQIPAPLATNFKNSDMPY